MLAPFHYPAFRAIWTANLASQLGSSIQAVGAAWLMTELTPSHTLVATVQASSYAPILLVGLVAGAIADNYDRRRVMLVAQWAMLVISAVLAALTYADLIGPYSLLAATLLVGTFTAFNAPAWQASVRAQVGTRDLPQAISLNTIAVNLARSAGPALGGVLIAATSVATGFAINAISYVAMIWVLLRWRPEVPSPLRGPMLRSIGEGLSFCAKSAPVRRVLLRGLAMGFGVAAFQALVPSIVRDRLHGSETVFGVVLAAFGIGSIVIAVFISSLRRRMGAEKVMALGVALYAASYVGLALGQSVIVAIVCAFGIGLGWNTLMTTINVAMQLRSPEHILGRCLSTYQAVTFGSLAIGAWVWGKVADLMGLPASLLMAAGLLVAAQVVLWMFAPMPAPHEGRVTPR
ncbi:MFS transporter [Novosphingobium flavum]|uniref:MFS transporter n=2 Tax=Novosphingobium flavum TaxID=1778672 RepID=A0A7X1FPL1_9SPHN|nr:MFS transporter [Novosphingobium flavum]